MFLKKKGKQLWTFKFVTVALIPRLAVSRRKFKLNLELIHRLNIVV